MSEFMYFRDHIPPFLSKCQPGGLNNSGQAFSMRPNTAASRRSVRT